MRRLYSSRHKPGPEKLKVPAADGRSGSIACFIHPAAPTSMVNNGDLDYRTQKHCAGEMTLGAGWNGRDGDGKQRTQAGRGLILATWASISFPCSFHH